MLIVNKQKNTTHSKGRNFKIRSFTKLDALRARWQDQELRKGDIIKYNKWTSEEKFKIIEIELRLEHYLCHNILVDLQGQSDLFQNQSAYFNKKAFEDEGFGEAVERLKQNPKGDSKQISIARISELSLGKKIIVFKYLKKSISS